MQGTTLGRVYEQFLFKHVLVPNASPVIIEADNDREELRISTIDFFNNKSTNLYPSAGVLYRPVEPNKKVIDCVFEDKLIQITTSATHQKVDLSDVMKQFPANGWRAVFLTLPCNRNVTKRVTGLSKVKKIFVGFVGLSDALQLRQ